MFRHDCHANGKSIRLPFLSCRINMIRIEFYVQLINAQTAVDSNIRHDCDNARTSRVATLSPFEIPSQISISPDNLFFKVRNKKSF